MTLLSSPARVFETQPSGAAGQEGVGVQQFLSPFLPVARFTYVTGVGRHKSRASRSFASRLPHVPTLTLSPRTVPPQANAFLLL
ncbi:unnamed protein product [Arctogadus glacialis]